MKVKVKGEGEQGKKFEFGVQVQEWIVQIP